MQFKIDEILDNFNSSPSVIDVSSESGQEFMVEPGIVQALDERFHVVGPNSDAMSAFVGAAAATLFPSSSVPYQSEEVINTTGSQIERQLIELIDEHQSHRSSSQHRSLTLNLMRPLNCLMIRENGGQLFFKQLWKTLRFNLANSKRKRPRQRSGLTPNTNLSTGVYCRIKQLPCDRGEYARDTSE